jgi:hypothetical protein
MVAASGRPSPYRADPYTTLRDSNLAPPDGSDMEILCSLDDHSRYAITVTAHRRVTGRIVVDTFSKALETQGIPASTLTDEGSRVGKAPDIHLAAAGRDRSTCRTLSHTNIEPAVADLALRHPTKPGSGPRRGGSLAATEALPQAPTGQRRGQRKTQSSISVRDWQSTTCSAV